MNTSLWSFAISYWNILLGVCFLLAAVWFFIVNIRRNRGDKRVIAIEIFRLVIVGLIIFTLFRPEFVTQSQETEQPLAAVVCDNSGSMETKDVVMDDSQAIERAEWLDDRLNERFWAPLEEKYKVVVKDFGSAAATDMNGALTEIMQEYGDLRTVILLSDGDWNKGQPPVSAATKMQMKNIPVFAVTVGSDKFLPDLELQSVRAPSYGLLDEHVSIPFTIQSHLQHDVETTVTLQGPKGMENSKSVLIPAMAQLQESILFKPTAPGDHEFNVKLPVEPDEVFKENNEKSFRMSLRREVLKVLVVDSAPRWEYRFLRNALVRDPGVEVDCFLLHPEIGVGRGKYYISSFPNTRESISKYDVVFLGDVGIGSGELEEKDAKSLQGLVEQQGSGLVFLPGMRGRQATLLSTPLGEMMPVVIDEENPGGSGIGIESRLDLTTRGRDHLLTMLASNPGRNRAIWKQLPGFYWHAPVVKSKAGSNVLAVHSTARNQNGRIPLLVTREYGNGKVLFMGTDSAWRWRRGKEDLYHYRFWGQVVRWMAHQRHMAHREGIRFFFSPESPRRGNRVFLHATVFNKAGFPLRDGEVHASITSGEGHTEKLTLDAEPGGWGVFTGSFVPREGGNYEVDIESKKAGRSLTTRIAVESRRIEKTGRPAKSGVMREIGAITDGKHGTIRDLEEIVRDVRILPEAKPLEKRFRLWCHPLWAGLIVVLLGLYWTGRKLMGQI